MSTNALEDMRKAVQALEEHAHQAHEDTQLFLNNLDSFDVYATNTCSGKHGT